MSVNVIAFYIKTSQIYVQSTPFTVVELRLDSQKFMLIFGSIRKYLAD
jgi:hypothetical protein